MSNIFKSTWLPLGFRILDNLNFLKTLSRCGSDKGCKRLLRSATREQVLALVEISANFLKPGCWVISKKQINRLLPFANTIRTISRILSEQRARNYIIHHSSVPLFRALLLPIIIEASSYLLSSNLTQHNISIQVEDKYYIKPQKEDVSHKEENLFTTVEISFQINHATQ
jgi:hypothetical protein